MHLIIQQDEPDDYVVATGEQHSVREFVRAAFAEVGVGLVFENQGLDEVGIVNDLDKRILEKTRNGYASSVGKPTRPFLEPGRILLRVDPRYFRPTEVMSLLGDSSKARERLGWSPLVSFSDLVHEMVWADIVDAQKYECIQASGLPVISRQET
jgi:GDPmannose 4,6-dehydratase